MRLKKILAIVAAISMSSIGCIKRIDVHTRIEKPILVVEGSITTDTVPYNVKLSYSGPFTRTNKIPDDYIEKDAQVSIADDQGNATRLGYVAQGIYQTTDPGFIGKVGRSYSVIVVLKDGRKYISAPEKIKPPVPVDSLHVEYSYSTPSNLKVYINVSDPANEENYYKWSFYSWSPRKTNGINCGFECVMYEYCFQKFTDKELRIFSDAAINGNEIKDLFMGNSPIYWYGKHYMDIKQYSISREAYQFFERYQEQQTRTGNILDPLPASIKGNVYNAADSNDFALGYFSASSMTHVRAILVPYNITPFLLETTAVEFIPPGEENCFLYFPDALFYPPAPADQNPPPPGWENAPIIKVRW